MLAVGSLFPKAEDPCLAAEYCRSTRSGRDLPVCLAEVVLRDQSCPSVDLDNRVLGAELEHVSISIRCFEVS